MVAGVQQICERLGKDGCYLLSIGKLIEELGGTRLDPTVLYQECRKAGLIAQDCLVINPAAIVAMHLKGRWEVLKAGEGKDSAGRPYDLPLEYLPTTNEWEILRFERKEESLGKTSFFTHFVLGDGKGRVLFDPLENSFTVRFGVLVSKRIFRRLT